MCTRTLYGCLERLKNALAIDPGGNLAIATKQALEPLFAKVPNEANLSQLSFLESAQEKTQLELFK